MNSEHIFDTNFTMLDLMAILLPAS